MQPLHTRALVLGQLRPSAHLRYFRCQKIIEGSIFRSCVMNQKLLSELDLGGPGDLRSDLQGYPTSEIEKFRFYSLRWWNTYTTETLEATEAVEAIKVTDATEAEVLLKV